MKLYHPFRFKKISLDLASNYIDEVLARKLDRLAAGYEVHHFDHGTGLKVLKVKTANGEQLVVRFHELDKAHPEKFFRLNDIIKSQNILIPELVFSDRSKDTRRRFSFEVSVEGFIEGEHFEDEHRLDLERIDQLAHLLAQIHSITHSSSKSKSEPNIEVCDFAFLMDRIQYYYSNIQNRTQLVDNAEQKDHLQWLDQWRSPLSSCDQFQLIHNDLNRHNIIFPPSGPVVMLDFIRAQFGFFEIDLLVCERCLFRDHQEGIRQFRKKYFELTGQDAAEHFQRNMPFFHVSSHLEKASSNASKAFKAHGKKRKKYQSYIKKVEFSLSKIRETIEKYPTR